MELPKFTELPGLDVCVQEVLYMPDLDAPSERPHPFVYFITITNGSSMTVTVKGRKWVVRQENAEVLVVEGDGVIGQFPKLEPGEEFSYNSKHFVSGTSKVDGAYFVEGAEGKLYFARIPTFKLQLPEWV